MKNLNFKILLDSQNSKRSKDDNGYLIVKDNPIALSGVYDYLLSEVIDNGGDEVVKVCREFSDLETNKDLFKNKPIIWEHKWTGEAGENQSADGAITGDIEAKNGGLYADLIIYNSDLIKAIEAGECYELSPGYEAEIIAENGSYNGDHYDYKQLLKGVNHLAVVEQGRTGHDLRILDQKSNLRTEAVMGEKFTLKAFIDALKKVADTEGEAVAEVEAKQTDEGEAVAEIKDSVEDKVRAIIEICKNASDDDEAFVKIKELISEPVVDECAKDEGITEPVVDAPVAEVEVENEPTEKIGEIDAKELMSLIEKITDSKVSKAIEDYKSTAKILTDSIDEVKAVVGDFDTSKITDSAEAYSAGYEILTGCKLQDGLDSKTAFKMEVSKRRPKQTAIKDSAVESGISKIASRFK